MDDVFFLTNVPVPYRMDFFNELGKYCHLDVLFEQTPEEQTHRSQEWFSRKAEHFSERYLYSRGERKSPFKITNYLRGNINKLIVIGGYSKAVEMVAILWLRLHRVPFILACDGGFVKQESAIRKLIKRLLVSSPSAYLSTSSGTDDFLKYYGARGPFYRIPLTTLYKKDIAEFPATLEEKSTLRTKLGMQESRIVVSVGQLIHRKGFDVLMEASNGLDDVGVYIIGGTPPRDYLDYKEAHGLDNVHFVGFKNKEELRDYYRAADLYAMPTREDIWGLVVIEAMAMGLSIVTTDKCLAGVELVDDRNGKVVKTNDPKALHDAFVEILSNPQRIYMQSMSSIKKAEGQTIEAMALGYMSAFSNFNLGYRK